MDERDFDKAATRLRKETARGSPPPASSGGAASTAQTPAHVEAGHTSINQAPRSSGWTPSVRPVPSLVELCTRSLVETKLTCVLLSEAIFSLDAFAACQMPCRLCMCGG